MHATIGRETVELVRYTNARQKRFHRVAKYLEELANYHQALARGEEVKETPRLAADTEEEKRCSKCRNGPLFLLAVLPAPLVAGLSKLFWKRISTAWQRWWHFNGRLTAVLNDNLSGVRVVKAFAQAGEPRF